MKCVLRRKLTDQPRRSSIWIGSLLVATHQAVFLFGPPVPDLGKRSLRIGDRAIPSSLLEVDLNRASIYPEPGTKSWF